MFHKVLPNLAYGNSDICVYNTLAAVVHACKSPCYISKVGKVHKAHPNYLHLETETDLYLNIIDPVKPLFFTQTFSICLDFIDKHIKQRQVLVHCNQGQSRSPALVLLYLAKRTEELPNSYSEAKKIFRQSNLYHPSPGIDMWLTQNWEMIK